MREVAETDIEALATGSGRAAPVHRHGDAVYLSGPAVSDRVKRVGEADIINGFTVDVNRAQLRAGVPVFVQLENDATAVESLRSRLHDADGIEHLLRASDGLLGDARRRPRMDAFARRHRVCDHVPRVRECGR